MRATAVKWFLSAGMLLSSAAGGDEVSLTRLVVQAEWGGGLVGVDANIVARFCGDAEGCEIVARLEWSEARTTTARLFTRAGTNERWFSSGSSGAYFLDGDGSPNQVFRLDAGSNNCIMDDGDPYDPGLDYNPGFEIGVGGSPGFAVCTIVISD